MKFGNLYFQFSTCNLISGCVVFITTCLMKNLYNSIQSHWRHVGWIPGSLRPQSPSCHLSYPASSEERKTMSYKAGQDLTNRASQRHPAKEIATQKNIAIINLMEWHFPSKEYFLSELLRTFTLMKYGRDCPSILPVSVKLKISPL